MADRICAIHFVPPIAFARLGGSTAPVAAYVWARPKDPRTDGETVIVPAWTLGVQSDGSVEPFLPDTIGFRDGDLLRPVCPFVEVWALVGDPAQAADQWRSTPLTPALLGAEGLGVGDLHFKIEAQNLKVARRCINPDLAFGAYPPIAIAGDNHDAHEIQGVSPAGVAKPLIPPGRQIPLGSIQVMRCREQPAPNAMAWSTAVDVSTVRLRVTPAEGLFYGPPQAAVPTAADRAPSVQTANAFLNPKAGWYNLNYNRSGSRYLFPPDTFDETAPESGRPLGVVDDTCEIRIGVSLHNAGADALTAHANVFVGPPDFAPDRRPFLSVADELNDRMADAEQRSKAMSGLELESWVSDLFQRIYECVSLLNVDYWRNENSMKLPKAKLNAAPIPDDAVAPDDRSMGSRDKLRNQQLRVGAASDDFVLPLSAHARERHRALSDVEALRSFVLENPDRLHDLIRGPFESEQIGRDTEGLRSTTMRMPPFMAQSTAAAPLTLAAWQYDLVMRWVQQTKAARLAMAAPAPRGLSAQAAAKRSSVLAEIEAAQRPR